LRIIKDERVFVTATIVTEAPSRPPRRQAAANRS